jgi:hypothetical protein
MPKSAAPIAIAMPLAALSDRRLKILSGTSGASAYLDSMNIAAAKNPRPPTSDITVSVDPHEGVSVLTIEKR